MKKIMVILATMLLFTCCVQNADEKNDPIPVTDRFSESRDKAIDFLYQNQLTDGEFPTDSCTDEAMQNCVYDSSPFVTSFVLYSLKDSDNQKVAEMKDKGLAFLLSEQGTGGVWKYWTKKNSRYSDPDVDDTSTISFILKHNNVRYTDNTPVLSSNKNKDGIYMTWIRRAGADNDVDCVVNANVLFYLGKNDPSVCSYLNRALLSDGPCAIYYPDKMILYYAVTRAYKNNVSCLGENKDRIIQSTLSSQKADGSFGSDMDTALALNTLMNLDYSGDELDYGLNNLLTTQRADGSWPRAEFYLGAPFYYGSDSLTSALAIEALEKHLMQKGAQDQNE